MEHHGGRLQHWVRELLTATFMAALLMVMHHKVPIIDVLDRFAFLFAASSSMQIMPAEPQAIVIGIDQKTFEQDFFEQSPLNRCVMAEKLQAIFAARPVQLVIDFDLSPSLAGLMASPPDAGREKDCESRLYEVLRTHATATRTILLEPIAVASTLGQEAKQAWRVNLSAHGILFGNGKLPVQFGFVQQQYDHKGTLAAVAHGFANDTVANHQKEPVVLGPAQHATDDKAPVMAAIDNDAHALKPLNFRAYGSDVRSLSWNEWRNDEAAVKLQGKTVFFGSAYDTDDRFITPIDDLYGVDLHAAAFISLRSPISVASAGWAMFLDILIGIGFGAMVARAWGLYLKAKLQQPKAHPVRHAFAFLYLWLLVATYLVTLWVLMQQTANLVAAFNIWISPLPMALGMTVDAFIMGAIHAIDHSPASHKSAMHKGKVGKQAPWSVRTARTLMDAIGVVSSRAPAAVHLASLLKILTWAVVVSYALNIIARH